MNKIRNQLRRISIKVVKLQIFKKSIVPQVQENPKKGLELCSDQDEKESITDPYTVDESKTFTSSD